MAGRACNDCLRVQNLILCEQSATQLGFTTASPPVELNRFSHIQIFMVANNANLQRFFEMTIGYAVKHNRMPLKSLLFYCGDTMFSEGSVEVGAIDVDFADDLREEDDAFVAVVLPCFGQYSEDFTCIF